MRCTIHKTEKLFPTKTRFGVRYSCPVKGCTIALWDGSTSTPADYQTRQARVRAHNAFDALWKSGTLTRHNAYTKLAAYLKLPKRKVHIGRFNQQQCNQAIDFSKIIMR